MMFYYELLLALGGEEVFRLMRLAPDGRPLGKPEPKEETDSGEGAVWPESESSQRLAVHSI